MDLNSGAARITYQYIEPDAEAVDDEEFEVGGGGESDVDGVVSGFNVECRVDSNVTHNARDGAA